jgi:hypothetical protein
MEARSRNHCCRANEMCITNYKHVFVALVIQHAKRIILSFVDCPAVPYFSYYLVNDTIFGGKRLLRITLFF